MLTRFDQKSSAYDAHAQVQRALIEWGLREAQIPFQNERLLEFGAGTGLLTQALVAQGAQVTATDLAPAMVGQGKGKVSEADWMLADAWRAEDFQGAGYDAVASSALLQWVPDARAVLSHWRACVKEGGRLFALIFVEQSLPELASVCPQAMPFPWRNQAQWCEACEQAGWTISSCQRHTEVFHYTDARALLRSLHGIGATTPSTRLGTSGVRRLIKDYNTRYADENGVPATWTFLRLEAVNQP